MKKTPVAILVRVSTAKQETSRQISELTEYAQSQNYQVVEILEESISGGASVESRSGLRRCIELALNGEIDKVLVHEVSRLARKNSIAHKFVEELEELKVSVYWHAQQIETLLPDGKRNPAASIMFALLAEMARNERETLSERVKSGLREAKRKGRILGRPCGTGTSNLDLMSKHTDVIKLLKKGISIRNVASILQKSPTTVNKVRKLIITS
ncbi:MAG: recombinase family protein [Rubritalea sp.]|tara:strand:- start:54 stop:689 length:636 start_codon:yes stop_codon:yes gene_type:complete